MSPTTKPQNPGLACHPIEIQLPAGRATDFGQAADAVKQEYLSSVKWKQLRCQDVVPTGDASVFRLVLVRTVEFDWTWEGATAFRPFNLNAQPSHASVGGEDEASVWSGEVVEVDEANGEIFVWVNDPDRRPTRGTFFVRPFEFLAYLHALYCDTPTNELRRHLPGRLHATQGDVHPTLQYSPDACPPGLTGVWSHAWSVLWGPPGTGKTHTVGRLVAACVADPSERVLVVSTTNKSTDESALAIGRAIRDRVGSLPEPGRVLRIGKSAHVETYAGEGLESLLAGTETDLLRQVGDLTRRLHGTQDKEEQAVIRKHIQQIKKAMRDTSFKAFTSTEVKVVVATALKAMSLLSTPELRGMVAGGSAPFTTVFIDEAGLISRAAAAGLSLLASRRVVLAGDSKQLAPISRISRILPSSQEAWLASSGLTHLRSLARVHDAVCLLRQQHRMHPQVSQVVSNYQYDGVLEDATTVANRAYSCPAVLAGQSRAIWYVLDDDGDDLPSIRAERGPGHRSWVRRKTRDVLEKLFADGSLGSARGLYITPFVAQARDVRAFLADQGTAGWSAATVHSQQGTEADVVIFDTVNAGSTAWPPEEWKRLVNVGLSRAREFVILLASRAEMREPYLQPLSRLLAAQVLRRAGGKLGWARVPAEVVYDVPEHVAASGHLLGSQIAARKTLRPVMSAEQQRLCGYNMDGKPRLVRGVAGSGKTAVLARWLVKTLRRMRGTPDLKILVVYANQSLCGLIRDMAEGAWAEDGQKSPFPWGSCVQLAHVADVLDMIGARPHQEDKYDYDGAARLYLARNRPEYIRPAFNAMFIDEAQDFGPSALQLLSRLVIQTDEANPNSRSVNIFYDNAQNLYGRRTPRWSEMGLDMRGRSSVMEESYRSTRPVTEYALNVLFRLRPDELQGDHGELVQRGLIEESHRRGEVWWNVRFNQTHGPLPALKQFTDAETEFDALGNQIVSWIKEEGLRPNDICVLYNGRQSRESLETRVAGRLRRIGARLEVQTSQSFSRDPNTVVASTAQSYKGYESEVIVVAGADGFVSQAAGVLANSLYVAMTRARSVLAVYGVKGRRGHGGTIMSVLAQCLDLLGEVPDVEEDATAADLVEEFTQQLGPKHRAWLRSVLTKHAVELESIRTKDGDVIAEPLFWFEDGGTKVACYAEEPTQSVRHRLTDAGIKLILPGATVK
jgi:hypothetical protein